MQVIIEYVLAADAWRDKWTAYRPAGVSLMRSRLGNETLSMAIVRDGTVYDIGPGSKIDKKHPWSYSKESLAYAKTTDWADRWFSAGAATWRIHAVAPVVSRESVALAVIACAMTVLPSIVDKRRRGAAEYTLKLTTSAGNLNKALEQLEDLMAGGGAVFEHAAMAIFRAAALVNMATTDSEAQSIATDSVMYTVSARAEAMGLKYGIDRESLLRAFHEEVHQELSLLTLTTIGFDEVAEGLLS